MDSYKSATKAELTQGRPEEEISTIRYRCPSCRFSNQAAVMPHSPTIAKHRCSQCRRTNEIQTREAFEELIADHVGEGKDRNKLGKLNREYSKDSAARTETAKVRAAIGGGRTLKTPLGDATLIG